MKYFVVSDIHSYFDEFKKAIDEAGFNPANENHKLIICGDLFDRGSQPLELIRYLNSITRKILIRGNHEDLFIEMCERGEPWMHDISNGAAATAYTLARVNKGRYCLPEEYDIALAKVTPLFMQMHDYYETDHYIFVHGWIPCASKRVGYKEYLYSYWSDWRHAPTEEWRKARWYNGMNCAAQGVIEPDKTIVCGHWHCSYGHWLAGETEQSFGEGCDYSPYYNKGIIAIDGCTAYTGKVNCIVIDD